MLNSFFQDLIDMKLEVLVAQQADDPNSTPTTSANNQ